MESYEICNYSFWTNLFIELNLRLIWDIQVILCRTGGKKQNKHNQILQGIKKWWPVDSLSVTANLFTLRKNNPEITHNRPRKREERKYTLWKIEELQWKNMLKFLQEANNRRFGGEDWLLINVFLLGWLFAVGIQANTFSPWLSLSKHCYDISHWRPFLRVLSSAEKCYPQHKSISSWTCWHWPPEMLGSRASSAALFLLILARTHSTMSVQSPSRGSNGSFPVISSRSTTPKLYMSLFSSTFSV